MAEVVIVGCKLPHGLLIELAGQKVKIEGSNSQIIAGGFGLTRGIDKALFDKWLADHKAFEPVAKGLIFAVGQESKARGEAKDRDDVRNGFEPLDPSKPAAGIKPEKYEGMSSEAA